MSSIRKTIMMNHFHSFTRDSIHSIGNDYDFRMPIAFKHLALAGIIGIVVTFLLQSSDIPQGLRIGILIASIVLILPLLIIWIVGQVTKQIRLNLRDRMANTIQWRGDER